MYYAKLFKVGDGSKETNVQEPFARVDVKVEETVKQITDLIKKEAGNIDFSQAAKPVVETRELSDDEVDELMGAIDAYQQKYFPFIKFPNLSKQFVWNIPKPILRSHQCVVNNNLEDIFDPMLLFVLILSDDPVAYMSSFLLKLEEMLNGDRESIVADSEEFLNEEYSDEESVDVDVIEEDDEPKVEDAFPPDTIRSMIDDARKYQDDSDCIDDDDIPVDSEDEEYE